MESPGDYQLCGRTPPIWSLWKSSLFLFKFFDQIKFYHVDDDDVELSQLGKDYDAGWQSIRIEDIVFQPASYPQMLEDNAEWINAFREKQNLAG